MKWDDSRDVEGGVVSPSLGYELHEWHTHQHYVMEPPKSNVEIILTGLSVSCVGKDAKLL